MTPHNAEDEAVAAETVDVGTLLSENNALREENKALQDRVLRALADAENTRRQADRKIAEAAQYILSDFARELLVVIDNLERTIEAARKQSSSAATSALLEGAQATMRSFLQTLERFRVRPIEALGKPFDPNVHEAIGAAADASQPPGTVTQVAQSGYTIQDRLLRPARVVVSKSPETEPEQNEANEDLGAAWGEHRTDN